MTEGDVETTEDAIYGGKVIIRQPARGYRVNVDTILLAASLDPSLSGRFIELGCGVGAGVLIAALNLGANPANSFFAIERDSAIKDLAIDNFSANAPNLMTDTIVLIAGDALEPLASFDNVDHVFFNPPYDQEGDGRAPAENRRAAYISDRPLGDWIKVWSNRMAGQGSLTLIQRPSRLPEILAALEGRLGGVSVFPIRPHAGAKARRIIVRAWKGSRAPLSLLAGLDLHPEDGSDKYTAETDAILRGEAFITLG